MDGVLSQLDLAHSLTIRPSEYDVSIKASAGKCQPYTHVCVVGCSSNARTNEQPAREDGRDKDVILALRSRRQEDASRLLSLASDAMEKCLEYVDKKNQSSV